MKTTNMKSKLTCRQAVKIFSTAILGAALAVPLSAQTPAMLSAANKKNAEAPLFKLWVGGEIPASDELEQLEGVRFNVIKKYEPEVDGYYWLKGTAITRYQDSWIASFGHNTDPKGEDNITDVVNARISHDHGLTWGPLLNIDDPPGDLAASHGVFLVHEGQLWAFNAAFYGRGRPGGRVHTRAYVTDADSYKSGNPVWQRKGLVAWDGFRPRQQPVLMDNGQFIVAGTCIGGGPIVNFDIERWHAYKPGDVKGRNSIPAVAHINPDNLTEWEVTKIPTETQIWGESGLIVNGAQVLLISRTNRRMLKAMVSTSEDYGQTWSVLTESNLPMANSKPNAGTLSTGQNYLVNTLCSDVILFTVELSRFTRFECGSFPSAVSLIRAGMPFAFERSFRTPV